MCGACGSDRGAADWARPFLAGLAARTAVANAATRLVGPAGPRVQARGGGWLVRSPTGAVIDCAGLGELVSALGRWLGGAPPEFTLDAPPSGRLVVPPPDARRGIRVVVDPVSAPRPLVDWADVVVVPDADAALRVFAALSRLPWSVRCFLVVVDGTSEGWAAAPAVVRAPAAEYAADLLLWVEWGRRSGMWDDAALVVRCPLAPGAAELDVEVRAGHVVRARLA
ncbi:MAG TPA: hypothetical protein VH008_05730 [Pseudonocardia sp.]|nr:hypothetical protein [Pseudonocardia sp.]